MASLDFSRSVTDMSPRHRPSLVIMPGDTVTLHTNDCYGGRIRTENDGFHCVSYDEINPATGPVYVEGAQPGDILRVDIISIEVADHGCMALSPDGGPLGDKIDREYTKIIPVRDGAAHFSQEIRIPISPMIGVIGTAPKEDSVPNGTPGEHGSNLDCRKIRAGTRLYLPVNVPGALLSVGDLHAVMGDGEVATCGLEICGSVTLKAELYTGKPIPTPALKTEDEFIVFASASTMEEASKAAGEKMIRFLKENRGMTPPEAIMLMSLVCNLEVCQIVNPLFTMRMTIPLDLAENSE